MLLIFIGLATLATAFISGLFGMVGGGILAGILFLLMPIPAAMMLHAITQMASNGWRAVIWRRYARLRIAASYAAGCLLALAIWSTISYVPEQAVALICLGLSPFIVYLLPARFAPNPSRARQGVCYGFLGMSMMILTGIAGPLLDTFFIGGRLDRREIVATKALCQLFGHTLKLAYFGGIIGSTGGLDPLAVVIAITATFVGTNAAKYFLEAMSDQQFRFWSRSIITVISLYYAGHGGYLLIFES